MRSPGCGKVESLKAASALGLILEPDFDIAFQLQRERLAVWIEGEVVWERVGHVMLFASECGNCKSPDAT